MHQELVNVYEFGPDCDSGGAGLISSTEDFALFHDALACGGVAATGARILTPESIDLMRQNRLSGVGLEDFGKERPGYGYGLGVRTHINAEVSGQKSPLGEFGWSGAGGAFSMIDTENRLSLTYFQQMQSWGMAIQNNMRNALYEGLEGELTK
jgi:CubicO group peptidase (beta-lactamase class C family)